LKDRVLVVQPHRQTAFVEHLVVKHRCVDRTDSRQSNRTNNLISNKISRFDFSGVAAALFCPHSVHHAKCTVHVED
jgi:hypothetical protein